MWKPAKNAINQHSPLYWGFQKSQNGATLFMFYGKMYLMFINQSGQ